MTLGRDIATPIPSPIPEKGGIGREIAPAMQADDNFLKHFGRRTADAVETMSSWPGELASLFYEVPLRYSVKKTLGKELPPYEKTIGKIFPGLSNQSMLEKERPEYLKSIPGEETESEWTKGVAAFLNPLDIGGKLKHGTKAVLKTIGKRVGKGLAVSSAATGSEKAAEALGVDPETAQWIKMATSFATAIATDGKSINRYKDDLYSAMKQARPSNAMIDGRRTLLQAMRLKAKLQKGGKAASGTKSIEKLDELIDHIRQNAGHAEIEFLEEHAKKLNEIGSGLYQEFAQDKAGRAVAKRNLEMTKDITDNLINDYASTNAAYKNIRSQAQEIHAAIQSSKKAANFMKSKMKKYAPHTVGGIIGGAVLNPAATVTTVGGGAALWAGLKGSEIIARVMNSPEAAKYYMNVLLGAAKEDSKFMNYNLNKLVKEIEDHPEKFE